MTRDEVFRKLEEHVQYIKDTVPPDDIYLFAEQTFCAAVFFLHYIDTPHYQREENFDEFFNLYRMNILRFLEMQHNKVRGVQLDLGLVWEEKEFFETVKKKIESRSFKRDPVSTFFYLSDPCKCGCIKFFPYGRQFKCNQCGEIFDE